MCTLCPVIYDRRINPYNICKTCQKTKDPRLLIGKIPLYLVPPLMKKKLDREVIVTSRNEDFMIENPRERIKKEIVPSEQRLLFIRKYWWLLDMDIKKIKFII